MITEEFEVKGIILEGHYYGNVTNVYRGEKEGKEIELSVYFGIPETPLLKVGDKRLKLPLYSDHPVLAIIANWQFIQDNLGW